MHVNWPGDYVSYESNDLLVMSTIFVFETGSRYVAQVGLKLEILLPQPPECWDYRRTSQYLAAIFS
jgi:hypothetical protein